MAFTTQSTVLTIRYKIVVLENTFYLNEFYFNKERKGQKERNKMKSCLKQMKQFVLIRGMLNASVSPGSNRLGEKIIPGKWILQHSICTPSARQEVWNLDDLDSRDLSIRTFF
ncbi:hypothetical protein D917_08472 [Trichinella nativa]|uniref:Uncharacterized protein n=1 Tax=Trichinella nativa TaxID=6335 RepID=A0A1Y3EJQ7_9BILA|nr:hypothetical protein D917_08472 [Trichinella nativa]